MVSQCLSVLGMVAEHTRLGFGYFSLMTSMIKKHLLNDCM